MKFYRPILMAALCGLPMGLCAQSAIDAYSLTTNSLHGTARFQAMGGAFTALGGDISSLNQNPAGIGIYRSSEIGLSFDIDMQKAKTTSMGQSRETTQTKADFTNLGYIGSVALGNGAMPYFNWGVSYSRVASFNRRYQGYVPAMETSLSNYIAYFTEGVSSGQLLQTSSYNPYFDSDMDWLSILAYNSYLIPNVPGSSTSYQGLFQNGSSGDASFEVEEKGYIDEYSIDFGGNVMNTIYWGVGFGITDLSFTKNAFYGESIDDARIPNAQANGLENGYADFSLYNSKHISGSGFNVKLGLIFKPINELRIGAAIHTPTWYRLTHNYSADTDYDIGVAGKYQYTPQNHPYNYSEIAEFDWRLRSPWRFNIGLAGVIGGRGILSVDYERVQYDAMSIKYQDGFGSFQTDPNLTADIKDYYQGANILRIGGELRATPWLSLRAGYVYESSNVKTVAYNGDIDIATSGTDPSYTFNDHTQYITAGLGLRYQAFYFDMAYVHKHRESAYYAFTNFDTYVSSQAKLVNDNNRLVFSLGYKF